MANNVITVKPSDNLDYCMDLMYNKKIRHLPVVENNNILGIISIGDVVKSIIDLQKETIQYLDSYIKRWKIINYYHKIVKIAANFAAIFF